MFSPRSQVVLALLLLAPVGSELTVPEVALLTDDACSRRGSSCGLAALQASMHAKRGVGVKGQEPAATSAQKQDISSEHPNARGLAILAKLLAESKHAWQTNNEALSIPDWFEEPVIARASKAAPITGGSLLLLCMLSLYFFNRHFKEVQKEDKALMLRLEQNGDSPTAPLMLSRHAGPRDEDSTTAGGTGDGESSVTSSGVHVDEAQPEEPKAPFFLLFRFATKRDVILTISGGFCGAVHGFCMPLAFFYLEDLFQAIYLPNDDGSLPPTPGPHAIRDAEVQKVGMSYVLLAAVVLLARSGGIYLVVQAADRQVIAARKANFAQILRQGPSWHDQHNSAELAPQLVNDTHLFREGIGERLVDFSRALAMVLAATAFACKKDWKLTLLMVFIMPISAACVVLSIDVGRTFANVLEGCYAKASQYALTAAQQIRTVTAFNGQRRELLQFQNQVDKGLENAVQIGVVGGFSMGLVNTVLIVGLSLGIYCASTWVLEDYERDCWKSSPPFGECRTGGTMMSAMYTVIWGFTMGLGSLGACLPAFVNARAALFRISAVIDEAELVQTGSQEPARVEGEVLFEDVFFAYPKRADVFALNGVTVRVMPGSTTAFVGSSGSGKSTLISLLLRFYDPQSGMVCLDGNDIRTLNTKWLRSKLALVEQEPMLFQADIFENIACGTDRQVGKLEVEMAAKLAGAHEYISAFPKGYQTAVGEGGGQLSGGQKQRLAIARALIRDPAVLVLDEATSALDSASERAVQEALDELLQVRGRTTIVVAHRLSTVRAADQICVLATGQLMEQGTHDDLIAMDGAYANLLRLQMAAKDSVPTPKEDVKEKKRQAGLPEEKVTDLKEMGGAQSLLEAAKPAHTHALGYDDEKLVQIQKEFNEDFGERYAVRQVWALSRKDYIYYILGVGFTLVGAFVMPYYSLQFAQTINIFNRAPAVKDPETGSWFAAFDERALASHVTSLCLLMQGLGILWVLQSIGAAWSFTKAGELLSTRVRALLFERILRQEMSWHDHQGTAQLLWSLGSDVPYLKSLVGSNIASAANAGMTTILGLGVAFYFSWRFTLCILLALPLVAVGSVAIGMSWRKVDGDFSSGVVSEAVNSIKTVTAFNLETRIMERYKRLLEKHMADERRIRMFSGLGTGTASAGVFMILAMAVFAVNVFTSRGLMQVDTATIVIMSLMTTVTSFGEFARLLTDTNLPREAARRIFNIIARTSKIDPFSQEGLKPDKVYGRIDFQEVEFYYPTRPAVQVLRSLTLTLPANSTTALVGPSGCGKSTTVGLLQRFYDPQGGSILFDGVPLPQLNIAWLRDQMSLVQQEPVLFARSILENIRYAREDATMEEVRAAAKAANADFLDGLSEGYATDAGHRGTQLSGGQKQRIAIARALLRDPAVLLLDEATSSLDAVSERQVQLALDSLLKAKPRTTVIIAHRLSTVRDADQICVFSAGTLVEMGKHDQLLGIQDGYYAKLVAAQQIGV